MPIELIEDDQVGPAENEAPAQRWNAIDSLTNVRDTLKRTREWALAKAEGVVERLDALGGEPTAEAAALIDEIRAMAGDTQNRLL
jgi:hypothetical protein